MAIKARLYVSQITQTASMSSGVRVTLQAVTRGSENKEWAAATPHGNVELTIANEPAAKWFVDRLGQDVLLSFESDDDEVRTSAYA